MEAELGYLQQSITELKKRQQQLQLDLKIGSNATADDLLRHEKDLLEMQQNYESKVREFKQEKDQVEASIKDLREREIQLKADITGLQS